MHRNSPIAMQSSKNFPGETPLGPPLYGRGDEAEGRGFAVARFLIIKNRRASVPDAELYCDREFVKKFFAVDAIISILAAKWPVT
jgi:hypothetical protein